jgi:hypothetical protein
MNHMQWNKENDQLHIDYMVASLDDEKLNFISRECIFLRA